MILMRAVALVLIAALLAGCLGGSIDDKPPGGPTATPPDPAPSPQVPVAASDVAMLLNFSFSGCSGYEGLWPVPLAAAQTAVPADYSPVMTNGPLGDTATVRYLWSSCEKLTTPSALMNGTVYGHVAVQISAPESSSADENWYVLRMLSQEDIMRTLWATAGYDVAAGAYRQEVIGVPITGPVGPAAWITELGEYSSEVYTTLTLDDGAQTQAYYFETAEGTLVWAGSYTPGAFIAATGTITVSSKDPFWGVDFDQQVAGASQRILLAADFSDNDLWLIA
jgi:hypothetical protein